MYYQQAQFKQHKGTHAQRKNPEELTRDLRDLYKKTFPARKPNSKVSLVLSDRRRVSALSKLACESVVIHNSMSAPFSPKIILPEHPPSAGGHVKERGFHEVSLTR